MTVLYVGEFSCVLFCMGLAKHHYPDLVQICPATYSCIDPLASSNVSTHGWLRGKDCDWHKICTLISLTASGKGTSVFPVKRDLVEVKMCLEKDDLYTCNHLPGTFGFCGQ